MTDQMLLRAIRLVHEFASGPADIEATLQELTALAGAALGAEMAGLSIRDEQGRVITAVYTDEMVVAIDEAQYESNRGPCLDAARTHTVFQIDNTTSDDRWPEFARSAARHGIYSTLSIPVVAAQNGLGALNFYARSVAFFEAGKRETGELYAGQCGVASLYWHHAHQAAGLAAAMDSRATIEQAKGVLMATTGCSAEEAFHLLRQQSQFENRKLRDVAEEITARQKR